MTMTKMFTLMGLVVVISLSPVIIGLIYVLLAGL
jgi:ABC-type sulfate transport system permease subunit